MALNSGINDDNDDDNDGDRKKKPESAAGEAKCGKAQTLTIKKMRLQPFLCVWHLGVFPHR